MAQHIIVLEQESGETYLEQHVTFLNLRFQSRESDDYRVGVIGIGHGYVAWCAGLLENEDGMFYGTSM